MSSEQVSLFYDDQESEYALACTALKSQQALKLSASKNSQSSLSLLDWRMRCCTAVEFDTFRCRSCLAAKNVVRIFLEFSICRFLLVWALKGNFKTPNKHLRISNLPFNIFFNVNEIYCRRTTFPPPSHKISPGLKSIKICPYGKHVLKHFKIIIFNQETRKKNY